MPKIGDTVLYSTRNKLYEALVRGVNEGTVSHLGKNGEPALVLSFLAPERESARLKKQSGYLPEIFTEFDVVHFSHEFSEAFKKQNGLSTPAQIAAQRGQGEWFDGHAEWMAHVTGAVPAAPPLHEVPKIPMVEQAAAPQFGWPRSCGSVTLGDTVYSIAHIIQEIKAQDAGAAPGSTLPATTAELSNIQEEEPVENV